MKLAVSNLLSHGSVVGFLQCAVLLLSQYPVGAAPLTATSAMERVKTLLTGFGLPQPLRIQGVGPVTHPPSQEPISWQVLLTDGRSRKYEAYLAPDESRITIVQAPEGKVGRFGIKESAVADAAQIKRIQRWMTKVKTDEPTRLEPITQDENGVCRAVVSILRNGYPFVSHNRYGYRFVFSPTTGDLYRFEALQNPPPVDPTPPKLKDKQAALSALKEIWDNEVTPHAINVLHYRRVWYEVKGEPELGYYLPTKEQTARLVWRITYMANRDVGSAIQGGDSGMLIDAVTGKQIPTTVVP
jgi:hypothetical protein